MKAFVVSDEYGDGSAVVQFAKHAVAAHRQGANELNTDFEGVSCRRYPAFDAYAEKGKVVPYAVMVEHGWWFECLQCGQRISSEPTDEDGEPIEQNPVYTGNWVFCSPACYEALKAEKAAEAARADAAAAAALEKWPGITICHKNGYEQPARVWFKFPGGQHQCDWRIGADTLGVPACDQDAWHKFAESVAAARRAATSIDRTGALPPEGLITGRAKPMALSIAATATEDQGARASSATSGDRHG